MKKFFLVLLLGLLSLTLFAQDQFFSVGLGGTFTYELDDFERSTISSLRTIPMIGFSGYFDATYLMVEAGIRFYMDGTEEGDIGGTPFENDIKDDFTYFTIEGLLKYPFDLGPVAFFPAIGLEYAHLISAEDEDGNDLTKASFWYEPYESRLYLKVGVGADFMISNSFYIRSLALFGYKFLDSYERDMKDDYTDLKTLLTTNYEVSLYAGFKL